MKKIPVPIEDETYKAIQTPDSTHIAKTIQKIKHGYTPNYYLLPLGWDELQSNDNDNNYEWIWDDKINSTSGGSGGSNIKSITNKPLQGS